MVAEYLPVLIVGSIIGAFSIVFIIAYLAVGKQQEQNKNERTMSDGELIRRLLAYAKPYWKNFVLVLILLAVSIVYDILAPFIIGNVEEMVKADFALKDLYQTVAVYAGILVVSMLCTYFQAIILQKTGQQILSKLRMDIFAHIETLSHEQLNNIPVGTLVTRVTNDTNAISFHDVYQRAGNIGEKQYGDCRGIGSYVDAELCIDIDGSMFCTICYFVYSDF